MGPSASLEGREVRSGLLNEADLGSVPVADLFGFTQVMDPDERRARLYAEAQVERHGDLRVWARRVRELQLSPGADVHLRRARLKGACRHGVLPLLRPEVWALLIGADDAFDDEKMLTGVARPPFAGQGRGDGEPPSPGATAATGLQSKDSEMKLAIEADLRRTFPEHTWLQSPRGQVSLRNVLVTFAVMRGDYCQGLSFIAATLLLALGRDEGRSIAALDALLADSREGRLMRRFNSLQPEGSAAHYGPGASLVPDTLFRHDLHGLLVECAVLERLVVHKLPRIARRLDALGCGVEVFAAEWFLTLFSSLLPADTCARVWDALLVEGFKVIHRVALALLTLHGDACVLDEVRVESAGDVAALLKVALSRTHNHEHLMRTAFYGIGSFPTGRLEELRRSMLETSSSPSASPRKKLGKVASARIQGYLDRIGLSTGHPGTPRKGPRAALWR